MENPEVLPIGIIAAILGSLFTIFLNRAFDLFQTKKEQKYKLQTSFFEQKLKAAEAAVTQWSNVATAYTSLSILYQRMKVNEEFNPNLFDYLNEKFDNQMQEAIKSSEMIANSILLYFDIEDELIYADKPIENLLESLSKIVNLAEHNQAIEESYEFINDPERIK